MILPKLFNIAEVSTMKDVRNVVITFPAIFNGSQWHATKGTGWLWA